MVKLSVNEIYDMVDELLEVHKNYLPLCYKLGPLAQFG